MVGIIKNTFIVNALIIAPSKNEFFFLENSSTQFHHGNFFTNIYWKWQAHVDGLSISIDLSSFPFSKHGYKSTTTVVTSVIKLDVRLANCFEGVYDLRDCVHDSWFWMSHCVNWASSSHSWNWKTSSTVNLKEDPLNQLDLQV